MKHRHLFMISVLALLALLLGVLNQIINSRIDSIKEATYTQVADNLKSTIRSYIQDKQQGTFAIALGLADNKEIINFLKTGKNPKDLKAFTQKLKLHTQYPDVWIQVVDNKGTSRYRTWSERVGDSLFDMRLDVREMIASPRIMNTISVGIFSMTFKSLVPVFDEKEHFLGSLEVISHFNTISRHLEEEGARLVILVDKDYRSQITRPITGNFLEDYYVVNSNADPNLLKKIGQYGVETFTEIANYRLIDNQLVTLHTIKDVAGREMGYFILFKPLESIDLTSLVSFQHAVKLSIPMGILLLITTVFLTITLHRMKETQRTAKNLEKKVKERTRELEMLNSELEARVARAIEKQRQQEKQLIQQEKLAAMSRMLTNISHHWRQPLNVLALNVQDIAEAKRFGELTDEYLGNNIKQSMEQINYMSKTIDTFSHFFKDEKSKKEFSLLETVKEVYTLMMPKLKESHISFWLPNKDITLIGFHDDIKQVLLNIINNAVDAILKQRPEHGKIELMIDEDATHAVLTICDNGGGIEEGIMDKIFEPYFTTKFESKGVGISLYLSKTIVENNLDGTLTVSNTADGACFIVRVRKNN